MNISLAMSLANASDEQIIKWGRQNGISLTHAEIKAIRSIISEASMDWLITGIPKSTIKRLEKHLGSEKLAHLLKLLGV